MAGRSYRLRRKKYIFISQRGLGQESCILKTRYNQTCNSRPIYKYSGGENSEGQFLRRFTFR